MKKFILVFIVSILFVFPAAGKTGKLINPLLETDELVTIIEKNSPVIIDIRTSEEFKYAHIPNSVNAPYDKVKWRETVDKIPGQIPPVKKLQSLLRSLGINQDSIVVVVFGAEDNSDFGSAARVYWTIKVAGIQNVGLLNGGYKAWFNDLQETTSELYHPKPGNITIRKYDNKYYTDMAEVIQNLDENRYLLVDARPSEQYNGYVKHKASKSGGTLPNAKNISQFSFIEDKTAKLKPLDYLKQTTQDLRADQYTGIISFCNTGHWAATNWFVFSEVLGMNTKLYDGSMVEWTAQSENPLVNIKNRFQLLYYDWFQG